jgi:hypothetical protein
VPVLRGAAAGAIAALCVLASPALAHEGNPNYNSEVRAIEPAVDGLKAQVLNHDDRIELRNDTGRTVVLEGYRNEPYLRFLPDGTVEVNRRSPAAYLNEDRFANAEVPATADPEAEPEWEEVAANGRYEWHDHRIHWMSKTPPEAVREDESRRVKVFDWRLPASVGGTPATISGTLTWLGVPDEGFPLAAGLSLAAAVLLGAVLVIVVRRRRRREDDTAVREAW